MISTIQGDWAGSRTIGNIQYNFTIRIESNKLTESTQCLFADGSQLRASVTVAAQILEKLIRVTESKTDESRSGTKYCGVTLSPREISYQLNTDKMTVINLNQGLTDELRKISAQ